MKYQKIPLLLGWSFSLLLAVFSFSIVSADYSYIQNLEIGGTGYTHPSYSSLTYPSITVYATSTGSIASLTFWTSCTLQYPVYVRVASGLDTNNLTYYATSTNSVSDYFCNRGNYATSTVYFNPTINGINGKLLFFTFYDVPNDAGNTNVYMLDPSTSLNDLTDIYQTWQYIAGNWRRATTSEGWITTSMTGTAPSNSIGYEQKTFNVCESFDIGCYFGNGLAWAFYPSKDMKELMTGFTFASSSPFSYFYDINSYLTILRNGTGTSTKLVTKFNGQTLTILDTANLPMASGDRQRIKDLLTYVVYILGFWVAIRRVMDIMGLGSKEEENKNEKV